MVTKTIKSSPKVENVYDAEDSPRPGRAHNSKKNSDEIEAAHELRLKLKRLPEDNQDNVIDFVFVVQKEQIHPSGKHSEGDRAKIHEMIWDAALDNKHSQRSTERAVAQKATLKASQGVVAPEVALDFAIMAEYLTVSDLPLEEFKGKAECLEYVREVCAGSLEGMPQGIRDALKS
jgi:hypothetical protein